MQIITLDKFFFKIIKRIPFVKKKNILIKDNVTSKKIDTLVIKTIQKSKLFDEEWYEKNYPYIKKANIEPLAHYLLYGAAEGCDPGPDFSTKYYLRTYNDIKPNVINPLFHYLKFGKKEQRKKLSCREYNEFLKINAITATQYLKYKFPNLTAINITKNCLNSSLRLNFLTDTLNQKSVFGGVATSLIFAALLSNKLNCSLRIIVRELNSSPDAFSNLLKLNNIDEPVKFEFQIFPIDSNEQLEITPNDLFISTSWWSSYVIKKISLRKKYLYILQEDEKIFYPSGDEHIKIDEIFNDPNMLPIINTKILYEYLSNFHQHIKSSALFFEPSFDHLSIEHLDNHNKEKYNLFFYSRPEMPRNLFHTGLELIDLAIEKKILNTKEWGIYFAGQDVIPNLIFSNGYAPNNLGKLSWAQYLNLLPTIDLALCFMNAPCPSYPPLDFANAGAIVLTNQYKTKHSLHQYSENIICSSTNIESLIQNFQKSLELAKNLTLRKNNYLKNNISHCWKETFATVNEKIYQKILNQEL